MWVVHIAYKNVVAIQRKLCVVREIVVTTLLYSDCTATVQGTVQAARVAGIVTWQWDSVVSRHLGRPVLPSTGQLIMWKYFCFEIFLWTASHGVWNIQQIPRGRDSVTSAGKKVSARSVITVCPARKGCARYQFIIWEAFCRERSEWKHFIMSSSQTLLVFPLDQK